MIRILNILLKIYYKFLIIYTFSIVFYTKSNKMYKL